MKTPTLNEYADAVAESEQKYFRQHRLDLFAAAALTGMLARPADERPDSCVESAWLYAREMLDNEPKE